MAVAKVITNKGPVSEPFVKRRKEDVVVAKLARDAMGRTMKVIDF